MTLERDYVLGTHDEEIARLGMQHRVWRARVLDGFARAGLAPGQTVIDAGAGPGFVALDLAAIVGSTGRVIAIERSRRFLDVLEQQRSARNLDQLVGREADLDDPNAFPSATVHAIWCRWALAFVTHPRAVVGRMLASLDSGGVAIFHEYFDYSTGRLMPPVRSFEDFVSAVMAAWRAEGGEPDIALELPHWLEEAGATIESMRPYLDVARPGEPYWQWPAGFFETGVDRLVALGRLTTDRAHTMRTDFSAHEARSGARMVTPAVLEIIARKH